MKILFLTQVLPYPLDAGPKVRNYYVLRHLAQQHEVTLVSFIRSDKEKQHLAHLNRFCHEVHLVPIYRSRTRDAFHLAHSLVNGEPFLIARDSIGQMHGTVQRLVRENHFDVVHADQLAMAQYVVNTNGAKKVLDEHNAVWTLVRRLWQNETSAARKLVLGLEWRKMYKYETATCRRFDHVFTVTDEDKQLLQIANPKSQSHPSPSASTPRPFRVWSEMRTHKM